MSCSNYRHTLKHSPTGLELVVAPMRAHRTAARRARIRRAAAAIVLGLALVSTGAGACGSHDARPTPTTTTTWSQDCRLGPQDCGYGDNGHNGDR